VIPGSNTEQDDVVVVVDEAGHDRSAAKIDLARARTQPLIAAGADGGEPSILYGDLCRRGPACIHRREPAVREVQITRASTRVGGCLTEDGN
jgi:hypothetical protein